MTVLTDPSYGALARTAAGALGASSPDVVRAILSQWQCELGARAAYPPPRNNPGNIARGLASELGLPYSVAPGPNPQPGNPIVTFPSASVGATAYARAIATHSRYAGALRAARAGDGLAFIRAIGSSGWGTGTSCMLSVYRGSGATGSGGNNGTGTPSPGGSDGGGIIQAIYPVRLASSCTQVKILAPASFFGISPGDALGAFPIPKGDIGQPCVQCADGWLPGVVTQLAYGPLGGWTDPATLPSGTANACVKAGMKPGQRVGPGGLPGAAADAAGSLLDLSMVGPLAVNLGVLGIATWLVLTGIRDVLGGNLLEGA